jgi:hypothetical protein
MEKVWYGLLGLGLHAAYLHHLRELKGAIGDSPPSGWPFAVSPRALVSSQGRSARRRFSFPPRMKSLIAIHATLVSPMKDPTKIPNKYRPM